MSSTRNAITRNANPKSSTPSVTESVSRRTAAPQKTTAKNDSDPFLRPLTRSAPRAKATLYKSSSCHNIKSSRSNSNSSAGSRDSSKECKPRKPVTRKPASTVALPSAVLRESNSSNPAASASVSGDRIYVNSDLLSRVEKEKKQYEARISELMLLTESRKLEIDRLSNEVVSLKEAKERAEALVQRHKLKRKANLIESDSEEDEVGDESDAQHSKSASTNSETQQAVSNASSLLSVDAGKPSSVANLENRIHEMEEANYTTTEELQATMGELCEMQRALDETQEENRDLSYQRAILLESLCTQTAKLEHCRLQIEQLKHLLVTSPSADDRESHYVELYASVEDEKQILLSQNNDLAQRCESLESECRQLEEKLETASGELERLKASLATVAVDSASEALGEGNEVGEVSEARVESLLREVIEWRRRFEAESMEHKQEVTSMRLFERDLLKAVQVAERHREESDARVDCIADEARDLRNQVERLSMDLENALRENDHLQERLSSTSSASPALESQSTVKALSLKSVGTMTLPIDIPIHPPPPPAPTTVSVLSTPVSTKPQNSTSTAAAVPATGNNAVLNLPYTQRLGLNPASAAVSPGGPGGGVGGGIRRTGPTVQSLIQTIENQVKAVQHQQKKVSAGRNSAPIATKLKFDPKPPSAAAINNIEVGSPPPPSSNALQTSSSTATTAAASNGTGVAVAAAAATRRLPLSAGNSPVTGSMVAPTTGDSAPGGPPPPSSPPSSTGGQSSGLVSRSKSLFCDDLTVPSTPGPVSTLPKDSFLYHPHHQASTASSSSLASSTATTPRLKRNLTIPPGGTTTPTSVAAASSSPAVPNISEAVSSVLSAADHHQDVVTIPTTAATSTVDVSSDSGAEKAAAAVVTEVVDPLAELAKRTKAGSKRNALLRWCQARVTGYRGVEVTNFSSSWNDGLALCALLHTFVPLRIAPNWEKVVGQMDKRRRFEVAFAAAESEGIPTTLRLSDMLTKDRPEWNCVMTYIASIYKHFEAAKP